MIVDAMADGALHVWPVAPGAGHHQSASESALSIGQIATNLLDRESSWRP